MADLCEEPFYSQSIKALLVESSPWWRRFYDSRMIKAFFDSKGKYGAKYLHDRSVEDVLRSIQPPAHMSAPFDCILFAYLLVALRTPINNHSALISQLPALLNFVDSFEEELISTPYRGTNMLSSSVEEASSTESSEDKTLTLGNSIALFSPFIVASILAVGLGLKALFFPSKRTA